MLMLWIGRYFFLGNFRVWPRSKFNSRRALIGGDIIGGGKTLRVLGTPWGASTQCMWTSGRGGMHASVDRANSRQNARVPYFYGRGKNHQIKQIKSNTNKIKAKINVKFN